MDKLELDSLLGNIYRRICLSAEIVSTRKEIRDKKTKQIKEQKKRKKRVALQKRS